MILMRKIRGVVLCWRSLATMVVAAGVLWPSSVLAAGIGSRPANPDPNNPRTQSIFIYQLNRGASKSDQLTMTLLTNSIMI